MFRACLLAIVVLMAGCVGNATLHFEGADATPLAGRATCDGSGRVEGTVDARAGHLVLVLRDGTGHLVAERTLPSGPVDVPAEGAQGKWALRIEPSLDFEGRYGLRFACG